MLYRLDTPTLSARLSGSPQTDPAEDAHAELRADQAQLDELAAAYGERALTLREYLVARKPIERRIETSRRRISRQRGSSALDDFVHRPGALRAAWPSLTLSRQRAIIAAVLAHITVDRAVRGLNRFDQRRLDPVWRV